MAEATVPNISKGHVPYDDAHKSGDMMFDVLTLIHAAVDLNEGDESLVDIDGLLDKQGRMTRLLIQAREKVAAAINQLDL